MIDSRAFSEFCEVDSTIISAPSSTKNKEKKRDPEACQRATLGISTITSKLLHGEEETVNGDSGYVGVEKCKDAIVRNKSGKKIKYRISRRPRQIRKLCKSGQYKAKKKEHDKSSVRAKV